MMIGSGRRSSSGFLSVAGHTNGRVSRLLLSRANVAQYTVALPGAVPKDARGAPIYPRRDQINRRGIVGSSSRMRAARGRAELHSQDPPRPAPLLTVP